MGKYPFVSVGCSVAYAAFFGCFRERGGREFYGIMRPVFTSWHIMAELMDKKCVYDRLDNFLGRRDNDGGDNGCDNGNRCGAGVATRGFGFSAFLAGVFFSTARTGIAEGFCVGCFFFCNCGRGSVCGSCWLLWWLGLWWHLCVGWHIG